MKLHSRKSVRSVELEDGTSLASGIRLARGASMQRLVLRVDGYAVGAPVGAYLRPWRPAHLPGLEGLAARRVGLHAASDFAFVLRGGLGGAGAFLLAEAFPPS
jgi:hypothetical protein